MAAAQANELDDRMDLEEGWMDVDDVPMDMDPEPLEVRGITLFLLISVLKLNIKTG